MGKQYSMGDGHNCPLLSVLYYAQLSQYHFQSISRQKQKIAIPKALGMTPKTNPANLGY